MPWSGWYWISVTHASSICSSSSFPETVSQLRLTYESEEGETSGLCNKNGNHFIPGVCWIFQLLVQPVLEHWSWIGLQRPPGIISTLFIAQFEVLSMSGWIAMYAERAQGKDIWIACKVWPCCVPASACVWENSGWTDEDINRGYQGIVWQLQWVACVPFSNNRSRPVCSG